MQYKVSAVYMYIVSAVYSICSIHVYTSMYVCDINTYTCVYVRCLYIFVYVCCVYTFV